MPVTQSKEDYLERIHELIERKGYARVSDIANELNFSRPSVTIMIQQLSREGYVNYEKYRGLTLTPLGKEVALEIRGRHLLLTELFRLIGVDAKYAETDVEGIEHCISERTMRQFKKLVAHLREHPMS